MMAAKGMDRSSMVQVYALTAVLAEYNPQLAISVRNGTPDDGVKKIYKAYGVHFSGNPDVDIHALPHLIARIRNRRVAAAPEPTET